MNARKKVPMPPSPYEYTPEWEGLLPDDIVEVEDENGRAIQGTWLFQSAVRKRGADTIDHLQFTHVTGRGTKVTRRTRAVRPERVRR